MDNKENNSTQWYGRMAVLSAICSIYWEHENLKSEFEQLKTKYDRLVSDEENRPEPITITSSNNNGTPTEKEIREEIIFEEGNEEWVIIGSNGTKLKRSDYDSINWESYTQATRKLLMKFFTRETLASSTLSGKPSPAWKHVIKYKKPMLDQNIVDDIVECVSKKCGVLACMARNVITIKCADENKLYRKRLAGCSKSNKRARMTL